MVRQVQPLRISKSASTSSNSSPNKMPAPRPLAEIGASSQRRNSPSYNQATKKMMLSTETSPLSENSSPNASPTKKPSPSPRAFWERESMSPSRFNENSFERTPSPASFLSPKRRASIERLQRASRVKNSSMYALESKDSYDPANLPIVERPSANRPLSMQLANNSFTRFDSLRKENNPMRSPQRPGHKRSETETSVPVLNSFEEDQSFEKAQSDEGEPSLEGAQTFEEAKEVPLPESPEKSRSSPSPTKSALARTSQFGMPQSFDPETGAWSDDEGAPTPRGIHRHAKSVTFHAEPPEVNEYEEQTPEPSVSYASGSRESSWESDEFYDQDMSFDRDSSVDHNRMDDSFDADLENAAKTPVVLPQDWSKMSPDNARADLVDQDDDVFEGSPVPQRHVLGRSESVTSDSSSRPLPPLPAFMAGKARRESARQLAAAVAASEGHEEVRQSSLNLQWKMGLAGERDRSASHESSNSANEEFVVKNLDTGERVSMSAAHEHKAEQDNSVLAELEDFSKAPPRISRESILRKVRNTKYDFEDDDEGDESELGGQGDSPARPTYAELAHVDPDVPIPSRENSRDTSSHYGDDAGYENTGDVEIKPEPTDDEGFDMAAIPAAVDEQAPQPPRSPSRMGTEDRDDSVLHHPVRYQTAEEDTDGSHYSSVEPEGDQSMLHYQQEHVEEDGKETLQDAMQLLTVKDYSEPTPPPAESKEQLANQAVNGFTGLPAYLSTGDYDLGMDKYITPSPPPFNEPLNEETKIVDAQDVIQAPPLGPPAELADVLALPRPEEAGKEASPPGTPDSVIHHSREDNEDVEEEPLDTYEDYEPDEPVPVRQPSPPAIPERRSTIKTGGKLKSRASGTPYDLEIMREQRRMVSEEHEVPPVPDFYRADVETAESEADEQSLHSSEGEEEAAKADSLVDQASIPTSSDSGKAKKLSLGFNIPSLAPSEGEGLGLDLEQEFDRVAESQKVGDYDLPPPSSDSQTTKQTASKPSRAYSQGPTPYSPHSATTNTNHTIRSQKGYLMRQNTKLVVATNRNFSNQSQGSGNENPMSPTGESRRRSKRESGAWRRPSGEQYLKTEPWNGKSRRRSVRNSSAQKSAVEKEPAPPLPGQESALGVVEEDFATGPPAEDINGEGVERGRLFVKVVGVKDLDLPMPKNDRVYFQLTLDNGLHCVTTSSLELGKTAPIGQEFELVVLNDLEFQLTLTTKLPPPPAAPMPAPPSPTKSIRPQKATGLSRFLTSPKKRAEKERLEREAFEAEQLAAQREAERRQQAQVKPNAWTLLHDLVDNSSGSFARAYINLSAHEESCFGRPLTVDVPCYNEWAAEKNANVVNSVRSKRGGRAGGEVRKPPYVVGKLELQLLYVPKPKGAGDEEMPKSLSSAVREMGRASDRKEVIFEGCLSQQGGDCTHWRRRFFRLQGPKLTAYHEHTHQKRAVINLSKASRVVDDKRTLVADPNNANPASGKGRRKSAFAEEDEGYQYVEEGFRIRFANGETIDFYADGRQQKEEWLEVLGQVIGKPDPGKVKTGWTDLVLAHERETGRPAPQQQHELPPATPTEPAAPVLEERTAPEARDFTEPAAAPSRISTSTRSQRSQQTHHSQDSSDAYLPPPRPEQRNYREGSKSAPTSPLKSQRLTGQGFPPMAPPPPRREAPGYSPTKQQAGSASSRSTAGSGKDKKLPDRPHSQAGVLGEGDRKGAGTPQMGVRRGHRARDAVRSMIF
ncbi:hypothetical protein MBLNU230_g7928t1 [Neophaeotheca triangularis]